MRTILSPLLLLATGTVLRAQTPAVTTTPDAVVVDLGNDTRLEFALRDGWLLGLRAASIGGQTLTSPDTVQRPILVQDHGDTRHMIQTYRLREAAVREGRVVIELDAVATTDPAHRADLFVMRGDRERVRQEGMTPELERLREAAEAAERRLDEAALAAGDERLNREHRQWREAEAALENLPPDQRDTHRHAQLEADRDRGRQRYRNRRNQALPGLIEAHPELAAARDAMSAWEEALDRRAVEFPVIHRDYYKFPIWRQPNEINTLEAVSARVAEASEHGRPVGAVRWILEPHEEAVAGWPWRGWSQRFEVDLEDGLQFNHLAVLGTWEMGGQAVGTEVIALRYRGLGGLVQGFSDLGEGGAKEAFTTTEIIAGAAGGAPLVSPVIVGDEIAEDRSYALRHRVGAWIAQPARGAGAPFLDVHHAEARQVLLDQLARVHREIGYQGFWADSFQNLFMSQLDWAQGTGDSLQRTWWEILAGWSREGISWTAESHSFPGQSCSIEVREGWSGDNFFLATHVNRAFRANSFPDSGQEGADRVAFGFMANKGWAAPDLRPQTMPDRVVPSFSRLAHEYLAALPMMRRSWQLEGGGGVLWLGYGDDREGVWFSMADQPVPDGVEARPILEGVAKADRARARHTYRVRADDLLAAFGIRRAPLPDGRLGRDWTAPAYAYPEWARGGE